MESNVNRVAYLARYGGSQGITMVSQNPDARFSHRMMLGVHTSATLLISVAGKGERGPHTRMHYP